MSHNTSTLYRALMISLLALLALMPIPATAQDDGVIRMEHTGLFPEGVEYDAAAERFLVGSLTEGTIYEVRASGEPTPFIEDPDLVSSVGIQIDPERNRLLVVSSNTFLFMDPTLPYHAELAAYDLESGERLFFADLAGIAEDGPNVANDVAVDADGNAYITDSLASSIYRVDPEGNARIFWQDVRFDGQGQPGLNGIEYHPDGFLLVPVQGTLYKVPLDDPGAMTQVELDAPIPAADGIILHPDGRLIVVRGQMAVVNALQSQDGWSTASTVGTFETDLMGTATTAAVREDEVYVVYSHILAIMQGGEPPEVFEIVRVSFDQE